MIRYFSPKNKKDQILTNDSQLCETIRNETKQKLKYQLKKRGQNMSLINI